MMDVRVFAAVAVALLCGFAGAFAMARLRLLVDRPNERSSHAVPTPRGGGVGLVAGTLAGGALVATGIDGGVDGLWAIAAGAAIAAAAGLADDVRAQGPLVKFGAQFLAAGVAMAGGVLFDEVHVPGIGPVALGALAWPVTLLWFVGLTNAYNFMDGLDALAGSTGAVAAFYAGLFFAALGLGELSALAFVLAAACLGFLALNLPPARIFMGDVGSQFLGFAFAGLGVLAANAGTDGRLFWLVPILLMHVLFDTLFTAGRRLARGENVLAAHRTHLYQRLNQSGASHGRVAALLASMASLQGACAFLLGLSVAAALLVPFAVQAVYAWWVFSRRARVRTR